MDTFAKLFENDEVSDYITGWMESNVEMQIDSIVDDEVLMADKGNETTYKFVEKRLKEWYKNSFNMVAKDCYEAYSEDEEGDISEKDFAKKFKKSATAYLKSKDFKQQITDGTK